jgi:glycerophosphoryl diester phosphodiesterase
MWVFHPLASRRLAAATRRAGIELITWTVDDAARMRALLAMGVDGICSNDPRLFAAL